MDEGRRLNELFEDELILMLRWQALLMDDRIGDFTTMFQILFKK